LDSDGYPLLAYRVSERFESLATLDIPGCTLSSELDFSASSTEGLERGLHLETSQSYNKLSQLMCLTPSYRSHHPLPVQQHTLLCSH
jgi:hypothetical protein